MGSLRRLVPAAALCVLLCAHVVAATDGDDPPGEAAIPPGEEELIASMLGRGIALHGCTLVRGGIEYTVVKAAYDCPDGEVSLQLQHPRNATEPSVQTARFAITLESGSPPREFAHALASRIRSQEGGFQWGWAESDVPADDDADDTAAE
jgi:hypothetical protein